MERRAIESARLSLVPSAVEHADSLWAAVESSLPELRPWMAWAADDSHDGNATFLETCEQQWSRDEAWIFTLFFEGKAAGTVGLGGHVVLHRSAELGYWLRSDLAGRGLMTEAGAAVVAFGFEEVGLHRIELHAGVNNHASNRVAEKLGFQRVGLLREASRGQGGWYDCYVYDLLETDERLLP